MSRPWLLVSPASRGIGLQLAKRMLLTTKLPVVATARRNLEEVREHILDGLDVDNERLEVLKLDVTGKFIARCEIVLCPQCSDNTFRGLQMILILILILPGNFVGLCCVILTVPILHSSHSLRTAPKHTNIIQMNRRFWK